MTIIRSHRKRHNFVIIDVTGLQDSNLSFAARGVLSLLLTKPDDWEVDVKNLTNSTPDGRDAVIAMLKELEQKGYLTIKKFRNSRGLFSSEYIVFETITDKEEWLKANPTEASTGEKRKKKASTSKGVDRNGLTGTARPERLNRNGKHVTDIYKDLLITDLPINQDPPCMSPPELGMVAPDEETHTERCAGQEEEKAQEEDSSQSSSSLVKVQEGAIRESEGSTPGQIVPAAGVAVEKVRERKFDDKLGMSRPGRTRLKYLYPDGDWLVNGCINEAFLEWKARDWMKSPAFAGKSLAVVKSNVASRWMRKDEGPAHLENDWIAFCEESQTYAGNMQLRVAAGISIPESEKKEFVSRLPAITSTLEPYAERPNTPAILPQEAAQISSSVQSSFTLPQSALEVKIEASVPATPTVTMAGVENEGAYKVFTAAQMDEEYGPPSEEVRNRIAQLQKSMTMQKFPGTKEPETEFDKLKAVVACVVSRKDPLNIARVKAAQERGVIDVRWNEDGHPTSIWQPLNF